MNILSLFFAGNATSAIYIYFSTYIPFVITSYTTVSSIVFNFRLRI